MSSSFSQWLRKQLRHMLPPFLFFFVIFTLADITELLRSEEGLATYSRFFVIVCAALVMSKVVLISDYLPCTYIFSKKPLIYNTVWKSFIYLLCTTAVRLLDHAVPLCFEAKSFGQIGMHIMEMFKKEQFWIVQMWLGLLLFIFVAYRELVSAVGEEKVKKLFFG
jgi:hypothetical protein